MILDWTNTQDYYSLEFLRTWNNKPLAPIIKIEEQLPEQIPLGLTTQNWPVLRRHQYIMPAIYGYISNCIISGKLKSKANIVFDSKIIQKRQESFLKISNLESKTQFDFLTELLKLTNNIDVSFNLELRSNNNIYFKFITTKRIINTINKFNNISASVKVSYSSLDDDDLLAMFLLEN